MIYIRYADWGNAIPDKKVEEWSKLVRSAIEINKENGKRDLVFCVSNSLPFTFIRLLIVKGIIDHERIRFLFYNEKKDIHIKVNEYGAIVDWPTGFCDMENDVVEELLKTATKKRIQSELFGSQDAGVA